MAVPTDEIYEKYLQKAISEINDLADEIARAAGERATVLGSGHPLADVMLLKYSPQESELLEGVAFYGRAGQAILKSLQRLHVDPMAVYGTNCLKFAGAEPDKRADAWLTRELHIVQPKLVVVMGEHALEFLNRIEFPLSASRGAEDRRAPGVHADRGGARRPGRGRVAGRAGGEDGLLERLQAARRLVGGAASILTRARRVLLAAAIGILVGSYYAWSARSGTPRRGGTWP